MPISHVANQRYRLTRTSLPMSSEFVEHVAGRSELWNGTNWSRVTSLTPGGTGSGGFNRLNGVSARSATDAWAVGIYTGGTIVLRWNGTSWTKA